MKQNLYLLILLDFLKDYFEEKSMTDVCAYLAAATQMPSEIQFYFVL